MRFRRLGTPEQEAARRAQQRRDRARMVQRQEEERPRLPVGEDAPGFALLPPVQPEASAVCSSS